MAADIRVIGAEAGLDLTGLNQWVADREQTMAPVEAISGGEDPAGNDITAVSFDLNRNPLANKLARVKLLVGGQEVVGPNEKLVCKGKAYISGTLTGVFLVRDK
jgi:hypothetical protein